MWLLSTSLFSLAAVPASFAIAAAPAEPLEAASISTNPVLTDWCKRVTPRLPKVSLADCRAAKLHASGVNSVDGLALLLRDFPADTKRKNPVRILLIGGIHGDEHTASSIVFKWMEILQKNRPQEFQWKVAPIVNPDGLLARKRVNARGVDLNRNFPTPDWDKEARAYWEKKTKSDPRRFPGNTPISEPESRWVFDTIKNYKPHVIISVHAPFGVLDLDGPAKPPRRFGRLVYNRVGVYPGSLGNYSGMHQDIPVLTIELPHAIKLPVDVEVNRIWQDMQVWIRNNISSRKK
jgi:protein MpaA